MPARPASHAKTAWRRSLLALSILLGGAASVAAQRAGYLPAGQFDLEVGTSYGEIDRAAQSSRWRLGRLLVDPTLAVRNIAYVSAFGSGNLLVGQPNESRESDLTASFVAGLRGYLPLGQRYSFAAHALPEYTWWQDQEDRRRLNGRYGAGFFGGLGRSELELWVSRDEGVRFFSREFEEQVNQLTERATGEFQIALVGAFSIYAEGRLQRFRLTREGQDDLTALATSDRDEVRLRTGVRYRFVNGIQVGIGVADVEVDFEADNDRRSTSIQGIVLGLQHRTPRWNATADVAFETVEVGLGPGREKRDETRGRLRVGKPLGDRLGLQLYADRNLVFSIQENSPFFDDTRLGLALRTSNRRRVGFRVFVETGSNEFAAFDGESFDRSDDFEAYGASVVVVTRLIRLGLGFTTTDYDSNLDEFDRRVSSTQVSLRFSFSRGGVTVDSGGLRLGGEFGPWT